ncbi:laccase [Rickenella mellea]|uniref:laccase n=1 Tax=Rickenella mellea TaxID=50990 RepID=A0A4Y7PTD7_9AGAM|nr:laccase [Rickenella mellea]
MANCINASGSTLLYFIPLILAATHVAALSRDLTIANAAISPDGFSRSAVLAEGTFPGPLLSGNKGDSYQINVVNNLNDNTMLQSTSIHWHGFFQNGTNWADGPSFVNQCPIAANNSFLYNFTVPTQTGTYWYHSHLSTQYCDGLRGPFVVYDPDDPHADLYDVDDSTTVITLADWYHTPAKSAGKFPTADSTLINGLGRYSGGPSSDLAVINVTQGQRYRFRLISTSCEPNYVFSIDNHTMTVIEADGVETNPVDVDSIQIYAGQRYSFILNANQSVDNYWIRADPNLGTTGFDGGLNSAILRYSGADAVDPTTNQTTSVAALDETDLSPLDNSGAPGQPEVGGADALINLDLTFDTDNLIFLINNVSFVPPTAPVLLQILSGTQDPNDLLPSGSVIGLPGNSVVELSLPGGIPGGGHPFHLHGHNFVVVRSAGSDQYNYDNPVRRDVVNIGGSGDNVTIRFTTDNPGPWFLHCHIDWHLDIGLAIVFAEDTGNVASANPVPDAWSNLCPIYNNLTSDQL